MKKALILIGLMLCASPLFSKVEIGLRVPFGPAFNFYEADNTWSAFIIGAGLTVELFPFKLDKLSVRGDFSISSDKYGIPEGSAPIYAGAGSFLHAMNFRYGFLLKYAISERIYAGIGETFAYTFSGSYGDDQQVDAFTDEMKGNEIFFSMAGGYIFGGNGDSFFGRIKFPMELKINYCLTTQPANLWEFLFSAGVVVPFGE